MSKINKKVEPANIPESLKHLGVRNSALYTLLSITLAITLFALFAAPQNTAFASSSSLSRTLNYFSIEPLKFLQLRAPTFSLIPTTKNPFVSRTSPSVSKNTQNSTAPTTLPSVSSLFNNIINAPSSIRQTVTNQLPIVTQNILKPATAPIPATTTLPTAPAPAKPSTTINTSPSSPILPTVSPVISSSAIASNQNNVVNIYCIQKVGTLRKTFTGSGILINNDGTILTNAHVAQFPLVAEKNTSVTCTARSGSKTEQAHPIKVVFVSPKWSETNAPFINTGGTTQTGVYDYALLKITGRNMDQIGLSPINISYETQPIGSSMILKSYPADILATSPNTNLTLMTERVSLDKRERFSSYVGETSEQFDILETGPSTLAQRGSSGGLIATLGNNMQAMITIVLQPRSQGQNKPIRGITPYHINKDLSEYVSGGLESISLYGSQVLETKFAQQDKERLANLFNSYLR
jgi:hypothetical protein